MKDYYKIGEISEMYDMSRDSLMYYEKLGIIKPTRDDNGYRLYSVSDIWRLNLIKELKSLGFSFKMIKEYLENRDLNSTNKLLENGIIKTKRKYEKKNGIYRKYCKKFKSK